MALITVQELEDAQLDVQTLEDIINQSSPGDVTSRLGAVHHNVARMIQSLPSYQGTWSGSTTYQLGHIVYRSGSSYVSLQNTNLNHTPESNPTWWGLLATQGDTGATGSQGATGATGAQGSPGEGVGAGLVMNCVADGTFTVVAGNANKLVLANCSWSGPNFTIITAASYNPFPIPIIGPMYSAHGDRHFAWYGRATSTIAGTKYIGGSMANFLAGEQFALTIITPSP